MATVGTAPLEARWEKEDVVAGRFFYFCPKNEADFLKEKFPEIELTEATVLGFDGYVITASQELQAFVESPAFLTEKKQYSQSDKATIRQLLAQIEELKAKAANKTGSGKTGTKAGPKKAATTSSGRNGFSYKGNSEKTPLVVKIAEMLSIEESKVFTNEEVSKTLSGCNSPEKLAQALNTLTYLPPKPKRKYFTDFFAAAKKAYGWT